MSWSCWDVYAPQGANWLVFVAEIFGWTQQRTLRVNTVAWTHDVERAIPIRDLLNRGLVAGVVLVVERNLWVVVDRPAFEAWCAYQRRLYAEQELTR